jgi:hypothetical protein
MACQFNRHRFSLIISFLVLFFVIACGAAATPDSEPTADAPEAQTEPAAAPTEAANAAPSGATSTANPQQTPESPQATEPAGTLNIGQKELGPVMGHPRLVGNPQIFLNSASGLTETLLIHTLPMERLSRCWRRSGASPTIF